MTTEYPGSERKEEQNQPQRSRAGVFGSVVALGLAHARLTITVVGRVPLVMLHSVQTAAKTGFSSSSDTASATRTQQEAGRVTNRPPQRQTPQQPGSPLSKRPPVPAVNRPQPSQAMDFESDDLRREFRLKDLTRELSRDSRPGNTTVRGAASDLMDTVARLHRDYAVVVSNFSEVISGALESIVVEKDSDLSGERQSARFQPSQPLSRRSKKEQNHD